MDPRLRINKPEKSRQDEIRRVAADPSAGRGRECGHGNVTAGEREITEAARPGQVREFMDALAHQQDVTQKLLAMFSDRLQVVLRDHVPVDPEVVDTLRDTQPPQPTPYCQHAAYIAECANRQSDVNRQLDDLLERCQL